MRYHEVTVVVSYQTSMTIFNLDVFVEFVEHLGHFLLETARSHTSMHSLPRVTCELLKDCQFVFSKSTSRHILSPVFLCEVTSSLVKHYQV